MKVITAFGSINMQEAWYDREEDILNIELTKATYWKTIELPGGVNVDTARDGSITGIELLQASKIFSDDVKKVIEHAKLAV